MNPDSVPRLKDVAAAANVSVAAASRILRGDTDPFSQGTSDRVVREAKRLGWRRNLLVNGLQTGKTNTIGVLVPPYDSFWVNVINGIHEELANRDYLPITVWIGDHDQFPYFEDSNEKGVELINRLLDRRVDGLIMWPQFAVSFRQFFIEKVKKSVHVAVVDDHTPDAIGHTVLNNEIGATQQVVDLLVSFGHRNIACLSEPNDCAHTWAQVRTSSFVGALEAKIGKAPNVEYVSARDPGALFVATRLLTMEPLPTAVFAVTDHHAELIYHAAAKLGKRIPEDLSVIGFGNLKESSMFSPKLTTVDQDPRGLGRKAVELVLGQADNLKAKPTYQRTLVDAKLLQRESVSMINPETNSS